MAYYYSVEPSSSTESSPWGSPVSSPPASPPLTAAEASAILGIALPSVSQVDLGVFDDSDIVEVGGTPSREYCPTLADDASGQYGWRNHWRVVQYPDLPGIPEAPREEGDENRPLVSWVSRRVTKFVTKLSLPRVQATEASPVEAVQTPVAPIASTSWADLVDCSAEEDEAALEGLLRELVSTPTPKSVSSCGSAAQSSDLDQASTSSGVVSPATSSGTSWDEMCDESPEEAAAALNELRLGLVARWSTASKNPVPKPAPSAQAAPASSTAWADMVEDSEEEDDRILGDLLRDLTGSKVVASPPNPSSTTSHEGVVEAVELESVGAQRPASAAPSGGYVPFLRSAGERVGRPNSHSAPRSGYPPATAKFVAAWGRFALPSRIPVRCRSAPPRPSPPTRAARPRAVRDHAPKSRARGSAPVLATERRARERREARSRS